MTRVQRSAFGPCRPLPFLTGLAAWAAFGATGAAAQSMMDAGRTNIVITATPLHDGDDAPPAPPAQTITAGDLRRSHALGLSDQLKRSVGGVFVNDVQDNPLQPDVNYRGFTASPLLGTPQGLSVYFDGVRVNQPFGDTVAWDLIPKAAIRSATLVPGSNPLFGRNSLGGAIAIATRDGASDPGCCDSPVDNAGCNNFCADNPDQCVDCEQDPSAPECTWPIVQSV